MKRTRSIAKFAEIGLKTPQINFCFTPLNWSLGFSYTIEGRYPVKAALWFGPFGLSVFCGQAHFSKRAVNSDVTGFSKL